MQVHEFWDYYEDLFRPVSEEQLRALTKEPDLENDPGEYLSRLFQGEITRDFEGMLADANKTATALRVRAGDPPWRRGSGKVRHGACAQAARAAALGMPLLGVSACAESAGAACGAAGCSAGDAAARAELDGGAVRRRRGPRRRRRRLGGGWAGQTGSRAAGCQAQVGMGRRSEVRRAAG